jgi:hypothetical protein
VSYRDHLHDDAPSACWCKPENLVLCQECTTGQHAAEQDEHYTRVWDVEPRDPNCWRCGGRGLVECDECKQGVEHDDAHIIVHRA